MFPRWEHANLRCVRVFNRGTIRRYCVAHPPAANQLRAWFKDAEGTDWATTADVRARYATASIVNAQRVVFNIQGNNYRLIVSINYRFRAIYIRWFGTHAQYNNVNAATI